MEFRRLAGACSNGIECPAVFLTEHRQVLVQGYATDAKKVPEGEALVEIPLALLLEAAREAG
ncbi:hypothetical protein [Amycolatopsis sp. NPDC059021]|uniref:hypothetical protein n=1 Tax=Amycolatopsis sp. NPDC059021 TaxID=3346704 RepID=UPI00366D6002